MSTEKEVCDGIHADALGIVVNCELLNVRMNPSVSSPILCKIQADAEVAVYFDKKLDNWYHICTTAGVEGYCAKEFIEIIV